MAKSRVGSLFLIVLLALAIFAAVHFYLGQNTEHAKRVWLEDQLQKITTAKDALEQERDELAKAKTALESQLTDASDQVQKLGDQAKLLSEQIASEKRSREAMTGELAGVKSRLEAERKDKLSLTDDLAKAKQSYQALGNELTTLRQAKEALERRVKEMLATQATEAERIVVTPPAGAPSGTAVKPLAEATPAPVPTPSSGIRTREGKVLVVNREFNFVVINLGSKDGLKAGSQLSIWRGDKAVAKAQVERIYDNMAAATLLAEEQKGKVQEGNLVRVNS
ncbi:MAG: hypothetical protein HYZ93_01520 [Candidatus Omnitrophica bacterium]|nr:hypothetical protein [Candidatus Omnitrophota bacterium]